MNRLLVAAAIVVTLGLSAVAQIALPDTPAGRQLQRWLDTFNGGSSERRAAFYRDQWAYTPNRTFYEDLREQTGGYELLKVEESSAARIVAIAKPLDADSVARLTFEVDADEPHRIRRFATQPIPRPADLAIERLSETELFKRLRADLERRAAADKFSGTVLVARNGKPIFTAAYGLADRERNVANRLDTRFKNGSMNKMFTAVATLTLAQAGKLRLDDPLTKYLPDYPNETLASQVTIHHLLTHTGGTGDIFGPDFTARRRELRTHRDYVNLYGKRPLLFEPGSRWAYSNYGFALLGAVIESVSGLSYYDHVEQHVYKPAGMTSTASEPEDQIRPNTALGYIKRPGWREWQRNTETLGYRGMAAGGGHTTVEDLFRFARALTEQKLLNAEYTKLLTTGKVSANGDQYAYGFADMNVNGVRAVGHSGGAPGQTGDLLILDSGYIVAVLANQDPPVAPQLSRYIASRLPK